MYEYITTWGNVWSSDSLAPILIIVGSKREAIQKSIPFVERVDPVVFFNIFKGP